MAKHGKCTGPVGSKPDHKGCPGKVQKFVYVTKKVRGGRSVTGVQMLDEWIECECPCHKKKTRKTK